MSAVAFAPLLDLRRLDDERFEAPASPDKGQRVYGGQFLAQALHAAQLSAGGDRIPHSLHAYFLRPGDPHATVDLEVEAVRSGRTFSARQVRALQGDRELFRLLASFRIPERGLEYAAGTMPPVPPPAQVAMTYEDFTLQHSDVDTWSGIDRPMDIRYVNPPGPRGCPIVEDQLMWMKIRDALPDDPAVHRAGLAYLSDSALVDHIMLPHGLRWQDEGFEGASLDHAMWFHAPSRADEWTLFVQGVEATSGGCGLGIGRFYDAAGTLVVTCMQQGLMRWQANTAR